MTTPYLADSHAVLLKNSETDKKRQFTGIANSGLPFYYHNGVRAIVDMDSLTLSDKVPVLSLHDRGVRLGFGKLSLDGYVLKIDGTLLTNDDAKKLAADADDGFPWQMSAHISAGLAYDLTENETLTVNGQSYGYPLRVLKNCTVPEVSFTPTGVDKKTIAMILSNQFSPNHSNPNHFNQGHAMTDQTSKTDPKADDEITKLKQQIAALLSENKKLKADKHKIAVEAKLSDKGFKKDDKGGFRGIESSTLEVLLSLDETQATTMIEAITPPKSVPEVLLSEQYGTNSQTSDTTNPLLENARSRKS